MITIREATAEDLPVCAALRPTYTTRTAWQLVIADDGPAPEGMPLLSFRLQQARLPRTLSLKLPSARAPLAAVWEGCAARLVAVDEELVETPDEPPPLLGYLLLQALPDQQQALIARLLVDPPLRRRGAGRALVRAARGWAQAQGVSGLLAHAPLRNVSGVAFYQRCGFRICGLSEHFYPTLETALLLGRMV